MRKDQIDRLNTAYKKYRTLNQKRQKVLAFFIEPEIHPWAVTPEELKKAHTQTLIGSVRDYGVGLHATGR